MGSLKYNLNSVFVFPGLSQTSNGITLIPLYPDQVVWLPKALYTTPKDITETWKTQDAACLGVVLNSRFCTPLYISKLREARQRATILKKENLENLKRILNRGDPSHVVSMSPGGEAEVKNLDNIISLTEMSKNENCGILLNVGCSLDYVKQHLEERNANFSSIHIHISAESGRVSLNQETSCQIEEISQNVKRILQIDKSQNINLVFADVDSSDELSSRRNFLCLCITALKLLKSGGMFVCRLCETMTRFTVGILYILHQLFDKLAFVKPVLSQLSSPQRYLVCKGYNSADAHFPAYLVTVLHQIVKLDHEQSALDVAEVVPMGLLYSEPFYSFVKKTNEQLAHLEFQNIVHLESIYLCPDKGPSSEEISKLREEVMEYLEK